MNLISTREINQAIQAMTHRSGSRYVFASSGTSTKFRIMEAKTFNGVQKVKDFSGTWIVPKRVWTE